MTDFFQSGMEGEGGTESKVRSEEGLPKNTHMPKICQSNNTASARNIYARQTLNQTTLLIK